MTELINLDIILERLAIHCLNSGLSWVDTTELTLELEEDRLIINKMLEFSITDHSLDNYTKLLVNEIARHVSRYLPVENFSIRKVLQ